jgi:hypothetical protein
MHTKKMKKTAASLYTHTVVLKLIGGKIMQFRAMRHDAQLVHSNKGVRLGFPTNKPRTKPRVVTTDAS